MSALREVLAAVGMKLPATPARALASLLLNRARLRLRGLEFRERDAAQVPRELLTRVDVSWAASTGLSQIDPIVATDFQSRNVRQALDAGEPHRIARALAVEAGLSSVGAYKSERRTERLLAMSEALARRLDDVYAIGLHKMVGSIAAQLAGRFVRAHQLGDEAQAIFRARCTGVAWEIVSSQRWALDGLWWSGQLREFQRRVPLNLAEAQERGDLFATINFRTIPLAMSMLMQDRAGEVPGEIGEAMASWSHGGGVQIQHWYEMLSLAETEIYRGDAAQAYARVVERAPALGRAQIFRVLLVRSHCLGARARSALAAAAMSKEPAPLLRAARRDARAIAAIEMSFCAPAAEAIAAGAAAIEGDVERAVAGLRVAVAAFDEVPMAAHAAAARRQLGRLVGGSKGAALIAEADAAFAAIGVARPERYAAMLVPSAR
jgi:hypothetical protein